MQKKTKINLNQNSAEVSQRIVLFELKLRAALFHCTAEWEAFWFRMRNSFMS